MSVPREASVVSSVSLMKIPTADGPTIFLGLAVKVTTKGTCPARRVLSFSEGAVVNNVAFTAIWLTHRKWEDFPTSNSGRRRYLVNFQTKVNKKLLPLFNVLSKR